MSLQRLRLVLPPRFAEACGYRGHARYVALHWMPASLELLWSDDGHAYSGSQEAFLTLCGHPATEAALVPFHDANASNPIRPWLLIDRDRRALSFGNVADVWDVLEQQAGHTPARPRPVLSEQQQRALAERAAAWLDWMRARRTD